MLGSRDLQYTSKRYRNLLASHGVRASTGDVGACWDNEVVERFFGKLKNDWLCKVPQQTREQMRNDVMAYMCYYNLERLHNANRVLSPIEYEQSSLRKVSSKRMDTFSLRLNHPSISFYLPSSIPAALTWLCQLAGL